MAQMDKELDGVKTGRVEVGAMNSELSQGEIAQSVQCCQIC